LSEFHRPPLQPLAPSFSVGRDGETERWRDRGTEEGMISLQQKRPQNPKTKTINEKSEALGFIVKNEE